MMARWRPTCSIGEPEERNRADALALEGVASRRNTGGCACQELEVCSWPAWRLGARPYSL